RAEAKRQRKRRHRTRRKHRRSQQRRDPDPLFRLRPHPPDQARTRVCGKADQRNLPKRVHQIPEHKHFKVTHRSPPSFFSASSLRLSSAIFFASSCLLLIRLITSSSLDPPNIRSTISRNAWLRALSCVTVALYS